MLLGKRPRPPMKRTTSITEFTLDLSHVEAPSLSDQQKSDGFDHRFLTTISPRNHTRNSADLIETASFLRACGLCNRRLKPGRDIYMYRGDTAFCSLECRQEQMNQDERKEKCYVASNKEASTKTGTVSAA